MANNPLLTTLEFPPTITGSGQVVMPPGSYWASLSTDIVFVANQSAKEVLKKPNIANFVEQALLTGKPRLQKLGLELQEIKVRVMFHVFIMGFNQLMTALENAAVNGTVLQWVWGTGEIVGSFVITRFEEKIIKTDETGNIFATEIELTLKEYAGPGVAAQDSIDANKNAFANSAIANPMGDLTPLGPDPLTTLDDAVTMTKVQNIKLQQKLGFLQQAKVSMSNFKRTMLPVVSQLQRSVIDINSAVNIAKNIKNAPNIIAAASGLSTAANSLGIGLGNNSTLFQVSGLCTDVGQAAGALNVEAQSAQVVKSWYAPFFIK